MCKFNRFYIIENVLPYLLPFVFCFFVFFMDWHLRPRSDDSDFYAMIINVLSILIGFLLAVWGVLIVQPDDSKLGNSNWYRSKVKNFFVSSLFSSFSSLIILIGIKLLLLMNFTKYEDYYLLLSLFGISLSIVLSVRVSFLLFYIYSKKK